MSQLKSFFNVGNSLAIIVGIFAISLVGGTVIADIFPSSAMATTLIIASFSLMFMAYTNEPPPNDPTPEFYHLHEQKFGRAHFFFSLVLIITAFVILAQSQFLRFFIFATLTTINLGIVFVLARLQSRQPIRRSYAYRYQIGFVIGTAILAGACLAFLSTQVGLSFFALLSGLFTFLAIFSSLEIARSLTPVTAQNSATYQRSNV